MYGLEGLGRLLDGMRAEERPTLVRGDRGYGTERVIAALEARRQDYLFKLMMKPKVKDLVRKLAVQGGWTEAGQGWEAAAAELPLSGWTRSRKVVVRRRRMPDAPPPSRKALKRVQLELPFTEILEGGGSAGNTRCWSPRWGGSR